MSPASEKQLRQCVRALHKGNIAHTLVYCLYWAQYATHEKDGRPQIYKTGSEISAELPITARTASEHLKSLAVAGYWTLDYRPRPGGISKVSWLHFTEKSMNLIAMAKTIDLSAKRRTASKPTVAADFQPHSAEGQSDDQMSENATSIQTLSTSKTTKGEGFILSKSQENHGKKETSSLKQGQGEGVGLKAPKWLNIDSQTQHMANSVQKAWLAAGVPDWDWTSKYSWQHLDEVRLKLCKRGISDEPQVCHFLSELIKHWGWLRFNMVDRLKDHESNLHRPSPMALAHACSVLLDKLEGKWADEAKLALTPLASNFTTNFFDEDL